MQGEKDFEHDIDFDDLHPSEEDVEEVVEVDLSSGEIEKGDAEDEVDLSGGEDADLDLDALLPPLPQDDRVEKIETRLSEQEVKDQQTKAVTTAQAEVSRLEAETTDLRKRLRDAREKGDTDKEMEIEEQLDDKRLDLREHKRALQWYESDNFKKQIADSVSAERPKGEVSPAQRRQQMAEALRSKPIMARWLNKNRWYLDPKTAEERAAAQLVRGVQTELSQKGISDNDARFYAELNGRLSKRFPEVVTTDSRPKGNPPSGGGEQGGHRRNTGNRVRITGSDRAEMRKFGLNPDSPEDLRAWAREGR